MNKWYEDFQGKVLEIVQFRKASHSNENSENSESSGMKIKSNESFQENCSKVLGMRHEVVPFFANYANM